MLQQSLVGRAPGPVHCSVADRNYISPLWLLLSALLAQCARVPHLTMSYNPRTGSAVDTAALLDNRPSINDNDGNTSGAAYSYVPPGVSSSATSSSSLPSATVSNPDGFKKPLVPEEDELKIEEAESDTSPTARYARSLMAYRASLGELCATFVLVYVACGTGIASTQRLNGGLDPNFPQQNINAFTTLAGMIATVIGSLTVALIAMSLIYSFAAISGCHMNPAVTVALWASKRTSSRKAAYYIIAQLIGANLAMFALYLSFNFDSSIFKYAAVLPISGANGFSVFFMEFLLTFILVFVILKVAFEDVEEEKKKTMSYKAIGGARGLTIYAPNPQSKLGFAPLCIGTCIGVLGTIGGSVSGGCYNPARYFAPALWSLTLDYWFFAYVLGELLGGCTAALMRHVFDVMGRKAQAAEERAAIERAERQRQGISDL